MAVSALDPGLRASWWRAALVSLAVLVLAGTVIALVRTGGGRGDVADQSTAADAASDGSAGMPATTLAPATGAGEAAATAQAGAGGDDPAARARPPIVASSVGAPRVIKTAALQLEVRRDVGRVVERAEAIALTAGGFVTSSATSTGGRGTAGAELTMRVPADRFDDVRRRIEELGVVRSSETGGEDVGGQLVDLAARLRTLRAEEGALHAILGRASDIGQILQVRDRLTDIRTQIEQLAGQQASLEDRVTYATIAVSIHRAAGAASAVEADRADTGLGESLRTALDAAEAVVGGMLVALGAALPFLLLGGLAWPVVRRVRRRAAAARMVLP